MIIIFFKGDIRKFLIYFFFQFIKLFLFRKKCLVKKQNSTNLLSSVGGIIESKTTLIFDLSTNFDATNKFRNSTNC